MHIFSWICSQRTCLIQGVPWATVKGSSKSSGTFPLIRRWVLGQHQKRKEKKVAGVFFSACSFVWIFFSSIFFFQVEKKKKTLEVNGGRSIQVWFREEVWALGHVVVRGRGVGLSRVVHPYFTRCCCCSPGLYIECPLRCSPCQGAGRHICPHTSRCLACGHEMACTVGQKKRLEFCFKLVRVAEGI